MLRVVLIDDEEDALDLLEILLQQIGDVAIVGRFTNPEEALSCMKPTEIDLVFLDIDMPGLKGTQAARKLKAISPNLMIIFITAYAEYAVEAFEIQSNDYLLKPFTLDRLQLAISRIGRPLMDYPIPRLHPHSPYIQAVGGFILHLPGDNKTIMRWRTLKEKEVCAYLWHHCDRQVDTDTIIEAIWPEHPVDKAKNYLYTCLSYLRKDLAISGLPISIDKSEGFKLSVQGLVSDTELLRDIWREIVRTGIDGEMLYTRMNELYQGEYMEGCGYLWAADKQIELETLYKQALRQFFVYFKDRDPVKAVDSLQRILSISPESETDARELMALYIGSGKRAEALKVYQQLKSEMHAQGIALASETNRLYERLTVVPY